MRTLSSLDSQQRHSLQILFLTGLLFWSSLASLLPTLPLYVEFVGGTRQQIGLVMGSFAIGLLLSRRWLGPLADIRGRKLVLLLGVFVAFLAPLGYLWVNSIPFLLIIRAFHGISVAAFTTGYSALVTDLSPEGRRGELIGIMTLVNPVGMALGPALGGILQVWLGYPPLFVMSSSLGLASLLLLTRLKESRTIIEKEKISDKNTSDQYWQLLGTPQLRTPTLILFLVGLVFGTLSTFIPLFIQETGVKLNPGLFYTTAAIASFSARLLIGRASDHYGRGLFITGGLLCYTISMFILCISHDTSAFLLAALLEGAGGGTVFPMMLALISDRCSSQQRGRFFSLCVGGFDLGMAIAGPVLGFIAEKVGDRMMFNFGTGLGLLAVLIFVTLSSLDVRHSLRFALGRIPDVYALKT